MSTFKILLLKVYKALKLKQSLRLGNQNSVDLNSIFPIVLQFVNSFSMFDFLAQWEKRVFGSPRILMQENSSFQPTLERHSKTILFSPFSINFVRAPELWSF